MKLGELIAIARECKGWSLRDLERETGISNAMISQIETGKVKDPGFSTVVRLSRALGLSFERVAKTVFNPKDILRMTDQQPMPDPPYVTCRTPEFCSGKGYCPAEFACND